MMRRIPLRKWQPKPAKQIDYTPTPRPVAVARTDLPARMCAPVPKIKTERSEPYLRLVATLPCCWCGAEGRSQAAHPNEGKGMGIKAPDVLAFPLCADQPEAVGCHTKLDRTGELPKDMRRELEQLWGLATRMKLRALAATDAKVLAVVERTIGL